MLYTLYKHKNQIVLKGGEKKDTQIRIIICLSSVILIARDLSPTTDPGHLSRSIKRDPQTPGHRLARFGRSNGERPDSRCLIVDSHVQVV